MRVMSAFRGARRALDGGAARLRAFGLGLFLELNPSRRNDLSARVDQTRPSWEKVFLELWEPLLPLFSEGRAFVRVSGPQYGVPGKRGGRHEAFARSFIGASFFLANREDSSVTLSNGERVDMAAIYREGIVNGTDPQSKEYWGKRKTIGRLVEDCSIAVGLMLTEKHIWDRLSAAERERVLAWFREESKGSFLPNNWQWFKVFCLLLLERLGGDDRRKDIEETLKTIDAMYVGDGWYRDGLASDDPVDYYSAWAMQYYALLFIYLAPDRYAFWKEVLRARAEEFFRSYQHFFAPGAHPPLYGRSQTYRWASISPWGLGFLLGCVDASVDAGMVKASMVSTLNSFLENGAVRKDGILTCGYYGEFLPMLEGYSSQGSPYWAFKGFSPLLLPEDHHFWKITEGGKEPVEEVFTSRDACFIVSRSRSSHVLLFPNANRAEYPMKYDKFAYSNRFLMNYEPSFPVDNSLLARRDGGKWIHGREILRSSCEDGISVSLWRAGGRSEVLFLSVLVALPDGYLVVHENLGRGPVEFCAGGFPLPAPSPGVESATEGDSIRIRHRDREVGMALLYGEARPGIHMAKRRNPAGKYSHVPYFHGHLSGKGDAVVLAAWGCTYPGGFELPTVEREGRRVVVQQGACVFEIDGWRSRAILP